VNSASAPFHRLCPAVVATEVQFHEAQPVEAPGSLSRGRRASRTSSARDWLTEGAAHGITGLKQIEGDAFGDETGDSGQDDKSWT
jgi:hypothetical protein